MTKKEKITSIVALALLAAAVVALAILLLTREKPVELRTKTFVNEYFNTVSTIYCYAEETDEGFAEKCRAVEELLKEYHELSDIYNDYDGIVNLKTLNDNAGGEALTVDRRLMDMLLYAKEIHTLTDGAVNVAAGAVLSLWHECREEANAGLGARLPDETELAEAALHCDISSILLDDVTLSARISDPKAKVDVGAVAKGYATERAAELLISMGADGYVLDIGSNLRVIGNHPSGNDWVINIRSPFQSTSSPYADSVTVSGGAVVTSGGYERYYVVDGKKYHHIINENTLMPADFFASVSVVHPDSGFADCMSTALFNMSYEDGLLLIARAEALGYGEIKAVWIFKDGEIQKN